jgi:Tfp pilus assembly protein PilF
VSTRSAAAALVLLCVALATGCSAAEQDTAEAPSAADTLVQTGLEQLEAGRAEEARTTFENAVSLDPGNAVGHYNLGYLAQQGGDVDEAAAQYDAALDSDPELTAAVYNRAILLETSDVERAVELYRRAIDLDPDLAAAHMRLGFALLELGDTAEAEQELATGVRLDPAMAEIEAPTY